MAHAYKYEGWASYEAAETLLGRQAKCDETGKVFTIERDGMSFNYALSSDNSIISDEGVNKRELRELKKIHQPFYAYVSSDLKHITGWKGNVLMRITSAQPYRLTRHSYVHGKTIHSIQAVDANGQVWYGRGNPGICITMRAYGARKKVR